MRGRDDVRGFLQQFGDPAHAAGRALQVVPHFGQRADRAADDQGVDHELGQRALAHVAGDDVVGARPQHQHDRAEHQGDGRGGDEGLRADALARGVHRGRDRAAETVAFVGLARVRLHRAHRAQGFAGQAVGIGDAVLAGPGDFPQAPAAEHDRQYRRRNADQRERGQARAGDEQQDQAADHGHAAAQGHRHAGADHVAKQFAVGGQARDQFTTAGAVVETGAQADQVAVELLAQVGDDLFAQQRHEIEPRRAGQGQHHRHAEQGKERAVDIGAAGKALVDDLPDRHRQAQGGGRGHRQGDQPSHEQAAMPAHERPQGAQAAEPGFGLGGGNGGVRQFDEGRVHGRSGVRFLWGGASAPTALRQTCRGSSPSHRNPMDLVPRRETHGYEWHRGAGFSSHPRGRRARRRANARRIRRKFHPVSARRWRSARHASHRCR